MKKFSIVLKKLREEHWYSQRELAEKLSISNSAIGMYESGKREPNYETLEKIADFFNVDMNYLLGKSMIRNSYQDQPNRLEIYGDHAANLEYFANDPDLLETYKHIVENDNLKLLFDSAKDLSPEDLEPVLILIDGIRKQKCLK